jgi:hypothetical protein
MKTWKPTAAGILSIISGAFMAWYHWGPNTRVETIPLGIVLGLIAIAGGIFAIRRKVWGLALAGAICAIVPAHPWGDLTWTPVLGILAALLVVGSRMSSQAPLANRPALNTGIPIPVRTTG